MESIEIWRAAPAGQDVDGNDILGDPVNVADFCADVAEEQFGEIVTVGRAPEILACTLYVRDQGPTGVLSTDLVKVRGQLMLIDAPTATWRRHRDGAHRGDVIKVRRAKG